MMKSKTFKLMIFQLVISSFIISCSESNLKEITKKSAYNLDVQNVEKERGTLILNEKYFLSNNITIVKGIEKLGVQDESLWRLHPALPTILNIPAPYKLIKKENNDSIIIISGRDTIIAQIK